MDIIKDFTPVMVAFVFMIFDIASGTISAWATGTYKSGVMREGGKHKLMLMLAICFGILLDWAQALIDLGVSVPAMISICVYITVMEICSIIENIQKGFPGAIPDSIAKLFDSPNKNENQTRERVSMDYYDEQSWREKHKDQKEDKPDDN